MFDYPFPPPPPDNSDFGFKIINLRNASDMVLPSKYILTHSSYFDVDARVALKNFPNSEVLSLEHGNTEHVYDVFMNHLPELQEVYESLIDERSKETFCGYWRGKILNQVGKMVFSKTPSYIRDGFLPKEGDIFIDCGACDGLTAARFADLGCKVYSFEMDKKNFEIASNLAKEKNFVLENMGLGSYKHEMNYFHDDVNPTASRLDPNGTNKTMITTIDSYICENKISHVDFIKMDVEGAELDVLKGAVITLAKYKPILTLSAYHKLDDLWTLMNFIKSVRPDYEFAIQQCGFNREDISLFLPEELEHNLDMLGLDVKLLTFGECILFAR